MGADYYKIQKLKGAENYQRWEVATRASLVINKLFKVVKPDYLPPKPPTDNDSDGENGTESTARSKSYEEYQDLDEQALAVIQLTCEPGPYQQIISAKTSREAWAKLKECYGSNTYATLEGALFNIVFIRAENYKDLYEYLSDFRRFTNKLEEMGDLMSNNVQAAFFKKGLPEHLAAYAFSVYKYFWKEKKDIDFEFLVSALIDYDRSEKTKETTKAYTPGNSGKQKKSDKNRRGKASNKENEVCKDCPNSRHLAKDCWNKHPEKKAEYLKKKEEKEKNKQDSSSKQRLIMKNGRIPRP